MSLLAAAGMHLYGALVAGFWAKSFQKATRTATNTPYRVARDGPRSTAPLAILIPARDEERVIETCVRAARAAAGPSVPILVLDDASTDRTGQILATLASDDAALHVLGGSRDALPAGWFGKPWACQRAAKEALRRFPEVEWLLFIDADVVLQEHAPALAVGYAETTSSTCSPALVDSCWWDSGKRSSNLPSRVSSWPITI
jgi:cellulose synthase/poly-beta-1,6-N-acetylglucosamine synthase-like glycosyltransferase